MRAIFGLGNPGKKYKFTRHNIGYIILDHLAEYFDVPIKAGKGDYYYSEYSYKQERVLLVKPTTYMNRSGEAVQHVLKYFPLSEEDILIVYDDFNLPFGTIRFRPQGSDGGHNGIRSIDAHCGKGYRRVRLGIGHPGSKNRVKRHVLGDFAKVDREWLEPLLDEIARNASLLAKGDDDGFMNKVAIGVRPTGKKETAADKPAQAPGHINQAGVAARKPALSKSGPMAAMLNRLLGKKDKS